MARTPFAIGGVLCAVLVACGVAGADVIDNIVINGGFEDPVVVDPHRWDKYDEIPGWQLSRGPSIEIQRGYSGWEAAEGSQWAELDSDIGGPGRPWHGSDASSAIFQDLSTQAGWDYVLTFAFSPRPHVADNLLEIRWGDTVVDMLAADGRGLHDTTWEYHTYTLTATSTRTRLEFGDRSVSDSFGTLVDSVSVTPVPEPASCWLLLLAGSLWRLRRR